MIITKKDRQAILLIVGVLITIAVVLALKYKLTPDSVNEKTLCLKNKPIKHHTVVVVDKSDMWDNDDTNRVNQLLSNLYNNIPALGRLTILAIVGEGRESTQVVTLFDMCNPGSEKECNEFHQSCQRIRKRYMESFGEPLNRLSTVLMAPGMSSYSPLFETLVQVIDDNGSAKLEIHFVSDLMENGRKFRFYDVVPLAEQLIKEYPLPKKAAALAIYVHMIERRKHSRELINAVQSVWSEYFAQQGAVIDIERLLITD